MARQLTTRQKILLDIKKTLSNLKFLKKVEIIKKPKPVDFDAIPKSTALIFAGPEVLYEGTRAVINMENWIFQIGVEVWTDRDPEEVIPDIHDEINKDKRRGGLCDYTKTISFNSVDVTDSEDLMVVAFTFETAYRTRIGQR